MLRLANVVFWLLMAGVCYGQNLYEIDHSLIEFNSNAPNEIIRAQSKKMLGVLNIEKKQFAFKVNVSSFEGFNSPLQQEHFNENYMESHLYPEISFIGKIIEDVTISEPGKYTIRAKGKLKIHGVSRDRILYATVNTKGQNIEIISEFTVSLADHDIKIPRIVNDKLATEVFISGKIFMTQKKK